MPSLSIALKSEDDKKITAFLDRYVRRIQATPPGVCPLAVQLALLQASAAQVCGKCVPCRDGLPQLTGLLQKIVACEADESTFESLRSLAIMVNATSDCAIGAEAAAALLEGLNLFAQEYESHIQRGCCREGIGQSVPCETTCPAHVNAPGYIALVQKGNYAAAVNMVRKDNPFPTACAFICEHPCENRCRRMLVDAPLNIRGIKRFAVEQAPANTVAPPVRGVDTGRSIAVIGGGPSGLTCAYFLSLMGHRVSVFEEKAQLGGMLRYGIPAYRFPRERLEEDIQGILSVGGITARCTTPIAASQMREIASTYAAVYVAVGAQTGKKLSVDNADAGGVMSAVELLRRIGEGELPDYTNRRVVVVGGGNVAIDCARTVLRAHAKEVSLVYRRRKQDMGALPEEIESALAEGVEIIVLEAPVAVEVNDQEHCTALLTQPQMIGPVRGNRPTPVRANKPLRRLEADVILMAVGQDIATDAFREFGMKTTRGCFDADEFLTAEGFENVFVGGDCQTGPSSAISAIAAGKVAARNIDTFLGYHHSLDSLIDVPLPDIHDQVVQGRVEMMQRPARERKHDYNDVELGMSYDEVQQECGRCLRCDVFGSGVLEGGRPA